MERGRAYLGTRIAGNLPRQKKLTLSTSDGGVEGGRITALRLEQAACNHLFGDHPEMFGITQHEADTLRDYIQGSNLRTPYEYVELFHEKFPQFMDPENAAWLRDYVNPARVRAGLQPLNEEGKVVSRH